LTSTTTTEPAAPGAFLLAAAAGYLIMWDEEDPKEFPRVRLAIGGEPRRLAG